jgi:hypothetical protein
LLNQCKSGWPKLICYWMIGPDGHLAYAYHYVIMVIPKLAYPADIVNISLLHPRFIGSCN